MKLYKRGEVWLVDLGLAAKVRPCLIVSVPVRDNERALVTIVPHTTSIRNSRFEVKIKSVFLHNGVFDPQNLVTIPHAKLLRKLGEIASADLAVVKSAIKLWLGL